VSFDAGRWAWTVEHLSSTDRLVLLAVCDMADTEGACWPSQQHLAAKTGLSDRAVRGALKRLQLRKLIARQHRTTRSGGWTSDWIVVACPPPYGKPGNSAGATANQNAGPAPDDAGPEAAAADLRNEVPAEGGISFRESSQEEPTRLNQQSSWDTDLLLERMPEPGRADIDLHNRAVAVFEIVRPHLAAVADASSPGLRNSPLLRQWLERLDANFVAAQIVLAARRRSGSKRRLEPIGSWKYFETSIDQAAAADPESARRDPDGRWRAVIERLKRTTA
jgi:hypothetical protein